MYKATDRKTGEICAIKKFVKSAKGAKTCRREIEFLHLFSHVRISIEIHMCTPILTRGKASIMRCLDHDTAYTFVALEWVEGGTLNEQNNLTAFTHREVETMVLDVLEALQYVHSHGVIHHDVKPANIMVSVPWSLVYMQSAIV